MPFSQWIQRQQVEAVGQCDNLGFTPDLPYSGAVQELVSLALLERSYARAVVPRSTPLRMPPLPG